MPDTHRQPLLDLLEDYGNRYPDEAETVECYSRFLLANPDCFKRSLLIGHVTGSAMVLDQSGTRVLLTHHRKLHRWLQPGGHADGDHDVARVAMKEAEEESGLAKLEFVTDQLLDVDIHEIPARGQEPAHYHYDCRFLLRSAGSDEFVVSAESHDLAWVEMSRITEYTDEESILRMISKIRR